MTIHSIQKCFALLCLGILWSLTGMTIVQHVTDRAAKNFSVEREKRRPAPFPVFSELPSRQWGKGFDSFFNDCFPCRKTWIKNYRSIFVKILHGPYAGRVPGKSRYEFYTGEIPELETYMGICTLSDSKIADWVTIFEGRKAWADAMGIRYFQVIVPYRAFIDEPFLPPRLRAQRRESLGERLVKTARGGPVASDLLYPIDTLRQAEENSGLPCYYKDDAHFSAYGTFVLFHLINEKIRMSFPAVEVISLYDATTNQHATTPKCTMAGRALEVTYPGEINGKDDYYLSVRDTGHPYPEKNVMTRRPGKGLRLLLSNDSMLRLSLDSWGKAEGNVHFPLGKGIKEIKSFMWRSLQPGLLESIVTDEIPDLWVEEMLEDRVKKLQFNVTPSLRNGAAFGRAEPHAGTVVPGLPDGKIHLLAVLERPVAHTVSADPHKLLPLKVRFFIGDECVCEETTYQGRRRVVFSPPIRILPKYVGRPVRVEIDGKAEGIRVSLRISKNG